MPFTMKVKGSWERHKAARNPTGKRSKQGEAVAGKPFPVSSTLRGQNAFSARSVGKKALFRSFCDR